MPWKETSVMSERIRFVVSALAGQQSFSSLCRAFGISRQCGYCWLARYQAGDSFTGLSDRSRVPLSSPNKTAPQIELRVVALRQEYGWGAKKLQVLLSRDGIDLSIATLNRILRRNGLMLRQDAHQPALSRFEKPNPNDLWQIDFKGRFRVAEGHCYTLSILDDHSRFVLGLYPLLSTGAQGTYTCIVDTMHKYGVPKAILLDHGTPWWNTNASDGLSWLAVQLMRQDIGLHFSGFRHPQTQGKVEALHRTIGRAFAHQGIPSTLAQAGVFFEHFVSEYNYVRPHEGIDMDVPTNRYQPSSKPFNAEPPDNQYPDYLTVTRLNEQGSLTLRGKRYFVAKPLANERVAYQEVAGKLLVQYRHTYVREIDLATGTTHAFSRPDRDGTYLVV
jgi:transposase InsO family protein